MSLRDKIFEWLFGDFSKESHKVSDIKSSPENSNAVTAKTETNHTGQDKPWPETIDFQPASAVATATGAETDNPAFAERDWKARRQTAFEPPSDSGIFAETANKNKTFSFPAAPLNIKETSPEQKAEKDYYDALTAPAKKQNAWLNALYVGMQAANKFFNPQDHEPVQFLGEAKHDRAIQKAAKAYSPYQQARHEKLLSERENAEINGQQKDPLGLGLTSGIPQSLNSRDNIIHEIGHQIKDLPQQSRIV